MMPGVARKGLLNLLAAGVYQKSRQAYRGGLLTPRPTLPPTEEDDLPQSGGSSAIQSPPPPLLSRRHASHIGVLQRPEDLEIPKPSLKQDHTCTAVQLSLWCLDQRQK